MNGVKEVCSYAEAELRLVVRLQFHYEPSLTTLVP